MPYTPIENPKDEAVSRELKRIAVAINAGTAANIPVAYRAPVKPRDGDLAICDGILWDPIADGVKRPVWYDATTATWKAI